MVVQVDRTPFLQSQDHKETVVLAGLDKTKPLRYHRWIQPVLAAALLLSLEAVVIVALFVISLEQPFRFIMVGFAVIVAIFLNGLYLRGERRK